MASAESCPCCLPCLCARSDDRARDVHLDPSLHPYREQGRESEEVDQKGDAVMFWSKEYAIQHHNAPQ
jgi:hypothetical protein